MTDKQLPGWSKTVQDFLGFERDSVSGAEQLVSTFGAIISITLMSWASALYLEGTTLLFTVPSLGASAVLLFAVPHGKLSQPWALLMGHFSAAIIGVSCYLLIPDTILAAGVAVGLSIAAMHLLHCVHPPGGATALVAVIGGPALHQLGYMFVLTPIMLNVFIMLATAIVFNSLFPWRRYPAKLMMNFDHVPVKDYGSSSLDTLFIEQAIRDMDLVVDITTEDLQYLFNRSMELKEQAHLTPQHIHLGGYYCNDRPGPEWAIRHIIDEYRADDPNKDMVIYQIVEGNGQRRSESCTRREFSQWARKEVQPVQAKISVN